MCVMLCANSSLRESLEIPLALAYRQTLQLCAVCHGGAAVMASHQDDASPSADDFELNEAARRRVMKRSAWLQAYCSYRMHLAEQNGRLSASGGSSRDWPKALEALAKTWGRILSLIGLRW
jgi:hypothetical protein